ncbi:hypothetical protein BH23GEM7_BH23GEM7_40220 [soil metagenome]
MHPPLDSPARDPGSLRLGEPADAPRPEALTEDAPDGAFRYDAFISYSRADRAFATELEARLERYRVPAGTRGRDGKPLPGRRLHIFRDTSDLIGTHLSREIEEQIRACRHLIVICSPSSFQDPNGWIEKEIEWYAAHHRDGSGIRRDGIIPVLLSGRPNHEVTGAEDDDRAIHPALYRHLEDPLAADFRARPSQGFWQRREQRREALLHLLAILFDSSKEELARRQQQRTRRMYLGLIAVLIVIAGALAGLAGYAFTQKEIAESAQQAAQEQRDLALEAQAAEATARMDAEDRLAALCKSLNDSQVLADEANHGSVYYFRGEYYAMREECGRFGYEAR